MRITPRMIGLFAALLGIASIAHADSMTLSSDDIEHGSFMAKAQEFEGFGCSGGDQSPQLSWSGAPEGTQAYAVFAYDPDAPTGSGWWHWQLINIPADITDLDAGAGATDSKSIPSGSQQMRNDYGSVGFGGACPPPGDGAHRYQFTVYALSQKLDIPADASAALTGYMVKANALASATIEALYKR
ncbi:MAG: YbhB/YbcL family Raf kinase inhibitor-like protein [Pseudomonadota bacterium]